MSGFGRLADEVEALSGCDLRMNARIYLAETLSKGWPVRGRISEKVPGKVTLYYPSGSNGTYRAPNYTGSLDDAMRLATGTVLLSLSDIAADGLPFAHLGDPSTSPTGDWIGIASRLELALCAAGLRAMASRFPDLVMEGVF